MDIHWFIFISSVLRAGAQWWDAHLACISPEVSKQHHREIDLNTSMYVHMYVCVCMAYCCN